MSKIYSRGINEMIEVNSSIEIPKNFTGIAEYSNETKEWWIEGLLHRLDGPAVERANGTKEWYKEGNLHRTDGPAVERSDGTKEWWIEGEEYSYRQLKWLIKSAVYLGTKKEKYNLVWLKFITENGIKEFPIIPGIEEDEFFKEFFQ